MPAPTAFARDFADGQTAVEFIHDSGKAMFTVPAVPPQRVRGDNADGLAANQMLDAHSKARALARAFLVHTGGI